MLIMRLGLYVSLALAALATWASMSAGYPLEVAMMRGLLAFAAAGFVVYVAELIVMTAPPSRRRDARHAEADAHHGPDGAPYLPAVRAVHDAAPERAA